MKKFLAILILSLIVFTTYGQKERKCLFLYESEQSDEFTAVVDYIDGLGIQVISTCEEEKLIFVQLNERYNDPLKLFKKIERPFSGKCHYKSNADVIMQYDNCKDIYIKEKEE